MALERLSTLPNATGSTLAYLREIVYCLVHFGDMGEDQAVEYLISHPTFPLVLRDTPLEMEHDSPFMWAMDLLHGGDWGLTRPDLLAKHREEYSIRYKQIIEGKIKP